jgi:hypothetical protein
MAQSHHLLVLANSTKQAGLCVAGRRIHQRDGKCYLGPWVRPVSRHGSGELLPEEIAVERGRQPQILDVVQVPLAGHTQEASQPENWRIRPRVPWRLADSSYRRPPLELLLETPDDLWRQPGQRSDRVCADYLQAHPPQQSLYLVAVQRLRARLEWNDWEGFPRERYRALFSYRGDDYELNITDPRFIARHKSQLPQVGQTAKVLDIGAGKETVVCVSLAREFNGHHYKVVATILQ